MHEFWRCPVCSMPLCLCGGSLKCGRGHNYDISRGGYVNLLQGEKRGCHGDNKTMTDARRRFLSGGYYSPLLSALCHVAEELSSPGSVVLDAGCGEGYYTVGICSHLSRVGKEPQFFGIDISKDMIRSAAGAARAAGLNISSAVASVYDIPMPDGSVDMILDIFSPHAMDEFTRVLCDRGSLVMAVPMRRHLWELKEILYEKPYENEVHDTALPGYEAVCDMPVSFCFSLSSNEDIMDLFAMTPYYYRTSREGAKRLSLIRSLDVTAQFKVLGYRRL